MKYSAAFRNNVLKKVIPPESRSVIEVSKETGVSTQTIYGWLKQVKEGSIDEREDRMKPGDRTLSEKFTLVMESKGIPSESQGEWLRSQGLHTEHVHQWEQELREVVREGSKKAEEKIKSLQKKNKELERELARKEKALAEMAALMALKKKADALWGDREDD